MGGKGGGINHIPNRFQRGLETIPPKSDVGQTLSPGELTEPHETCFSHCTEGKTEAQRGPGKPHTWHDVLKYS